MPQFYIYFKDVPDPAKSTDPYLMIEKDGSILYKDDPLRRPVESIIIETSDAAIVPLTFHRPSDIALGQIAVASSGNMDGGGLLWKYESTNLVLLFMPPARYKDEHEYAFNAGSPSLVLKVTIKHL